MALLIIILCRETYRFLAVLLYHSIQILHDGNAIAMASVNPASDEATRNILTYSGAEYPASIPTPQAPDSLVGNWKLDENE